MEIIIKVINNIKLIFFSEMKVEILYSINIFFGWIMVYWIYLIFYYLKIM